MKTDNFKNYIFTFFLIIFFLINIYQLNNQHWSGVMDQDSMIIYNSLLISSGYEQEYRDHPAFLTFLIHGFLYKFISFFQSSYPANIDQILDSSKIDETFQFYFIISRITNYFINALFLLFFYKLLIQLKIKKENSLLICLIFCFSKWYTMSFFALRSEILSLLFFSLAMIFSLSRKKLILSYFISGIFLSFAMLTKIQIIFFAAFLFIQIPFIFLNENIEKSDISKSKILNNYLVISLIAILIGFILFQFFIQDYSRFERNKYLDLFFFLFSFSIIVIFYLIINQFKLLYFKKNLILLSSILNGFIFSAAIFIILDKLNLLNINDYIFLRITNPIHYMSEFTKTYAEGSIDLIFLANSFYDIFTGYIYSYLELLILLIIVLLSINKNYNKNSLYLKYIIILLFIFFINATISSYRAGEQYHSYYIFCYLILIGVCTNGFNLKLSKYFLFFLLLIFSYNNYYTNTFSVNSYYKELFSRKNSVIEICNEVKSKKISKKYYATIDYLKYWHNKFDNTAIQKLCIKY